MTLCIVLRIVTKSGYIWPDKLLAGEMEGKKHESKKFKKSYPENTMSITVASNQYWKGTMPAVHHIIIKYNQTLVACFKTYRP